MLRARRYDGQRSFPGLHQGRERGGRQRACAKAASASKKESGAQEEERQSDAVNVLIFECESELTAFSDQEPRGHHRQSQISPLRQHGGPGESCSLVRSVRLLTVMLTRRQAKPVVKQPVIAEESESEESSEEESDDPAAGQNDSAEETDDTM